MDFLNCVADVMFHAKSRIVPDNPRNVQIIMKELMIDLQKQEVSTIENWRLRMQGHIELKNHIHLFGDLDPDIEY